MLRIPRIPILPLAASLLVAVSVSAIALSPPNSSRNPNSRLPRMEFGIDRSNMATEWTLSPPGLPNIYPFNGPYNAPGVFEARRTAVFEGIGRVHPQWFRDGFGKDTPEDTKLFVDTVKQVHKNGMKMLAVIGQTGSDFDSKDWIDPKTSGCQWGTYPLSKIDLAKFEHRLRTHFDAVKAAGLSVDAFEAGNELDLYCNDADMPKTSEFAAHQWKWFLTPQQVHAFAAGYAPFLKRYVEIVREYFPYAKIVTCGMSNPTGNSMPLIRALANFKDKTGNAFDYTSLVDGYGTHIYLPSTRTLDMVNRSFADLTAQAALLPNLNRKPIWITEWSESGSAFWSSHKWYFQYREDGTPGGDLNLADSRRKYPAMTRAQAIRVFEKDVLEKLRSQANPVNIGYLLYYSYDSVGKTTMCDETGFNKRIGVTGYCFSGVIDPATGDLLPDVVSALTAVR